MVTFRKPLLVLLLMWSCGPVARETRAAPTITAGDAFPEVALPVPAAPGEREYLGLGAGETFVPSQIHADVVLVEVLNVHCPHCQMQAPSYNELYRLIEADPATRGRIKLLGLGAGNLPEEIEDFRRSQGVRFPIIPDASLTVLRALGVRATPFSIYLRQRGPGTTGVVAGTHLGLNTDYEPLLVRLREVADADAANLRGEEKPTEPSPPPVAQVYSEAEIQRRVRTAMLELEGTPTAVEKLTLGSGRQVYAGTPRDPGGGPALFAEVVSRVSICDICHSLEFIYVFNGIGRVLAFVPLQVTKYGNVNWNAADIEAMRQRVVGRRLAALPPFDPKVDAVTSATITSAMIFDSLSEGRTLLAELREGGHL